MHKRSLNFKNEYYDSKVKLLTSVEALIRGKIDEIVNYKQENSFTAVDLNDSLDYHAENLEELNRINQIREEVYESVHIPMKKTTSKYVEGSPNIAARNRSPLLTPKRSSSPVLMKKSLIKNRELEKSQSKSRNVSRVAFNNIPKSRADEHIPDNRFKGEYNEKT